MKREQCCLSVRKGVVKEWYLEQIIEEASFSGSAEAMGKIDYCTGPRENHWPSCVPGDIR